MPLVSCPHAVRCAGCPLIELPLDEQLAHKHARVLRAVARFETLSGLAVEPTRGAEGVEAYRTRAKLVVGPGPALGLFAKEGDHVVVDIPECRVQSPALLSVSAAVRALLREPPAEAASCLRAPVLRAVDLREALEPGGEARVLVTFVVDAGAPRAREEPLTPALSPFRGEGAGGGRAREQLPYDRALAAAAEALAAASPPVLSVAVSVQEGRSPQLLGRDLRVLRGPGKARDRLSDLVWAHATHGGFVQAHRGQAARIHDQVCDALERALGGLGGRRVVDAYAGGGAIGLMVAARGARVVLVESHGPSAEHARAAAAAQGLDVEVLPGDAGDALEGLDGADAIVLNPPRRGVAPRVRALAASRARSTIAYVSCDPDTLARDLDDLARLGWAADALVPFDMIPQTEEVETVAILARRAPVPARVLHDGEGLLAIDKRAHEVARAEGATPIVPLETHASGVCLLARMPADAARWSSALAAPGARMELVALCRGGLPARPALARASVRHVEELAGHTLVSIRTTYGGTRKLRRQLASLGHPILGDDRDGHAPSNRHLLERHGLDRPFLHCARVTAPGLDVSAPLPGALVMVLERLRAV